MLAIQYTHKRTLKYYKISIVEILPASSKQHQNIDICFIDTRLCGLSKQVKILVSSNIEYFFLTYIVYTEDNQVKTVFHLQQYFCTKT